MGVLLQGFYFGPGRIAGVPSPLKNIEQRILRDFCAGDEGTGGE
jgi:hypothetical protein